MGESESSTPVAGTTPVVDLQQYRCKKCNARLFDFKILFGAVIIECKCPKNKCGEMNVLKMGVTKSAEE